MPLPKSELIRNLGQIYQLLNRVQEDHILLKVALDGSNETFNTALIKVDPNNGEIWLDQLHLESGHEQMEESLTIGVQCFDQGVDIKFDTVVTSVVNDHDVVHYVCAVPKSIDYLQRRENYRVPIKLTLNAIVALTTQSQNLAGTLTNISLGGIGGEIDAKRKLESNKPYHCLLRVPSQGMAAVNVEIRFIDKIIHGGKRRFGAQFINLEKSQSKLIEKLVFELQREQLKNNKHID